MTGRARLQREGHGFGLVTVGALALLTAAQAADYLTFLLMVDVHGLAAERNPIVVGIASHGLGALTVGKAAAVLFVGSVFLVIRVRRPLVAGLTLGIGIIVGVIGALSNLAAL